MAGNLSGLGHNSNDDLGIVGKALGLPYPGVAILRTLIAGLWDCGNNSCIYTELSSYCGGINLGTLIKPVHNQVPACTPASLLLLCSMVCSPVGVVGV